MSCFADGRCVDTAESPRGHKHGRREAIQERRVKYWIRIPSKAVFTRAILPDALTVGVP